ncbi:hypothetical protein JCM15415_07450 [Methanobacterium movens]
MLLLQPTTTKNPPKNKHHLANANNKSGKISEKIEKKKEKQFSTKIYQKLTKQKFKKRSK